MPDIGEITVITRTLLSRARQAATKATLGRAVLTISAAALATAGLAACGGSSTPAASTSSAAPASAPPSSAVPASSSPAAASAGSAGSLNVCSVLTSAQVASITHDVVELSTPTNADGVSVCAYALSNSIFEVEVAPSASAIGWAGFSTLVSSQAKPAGSATPVPGLGQQAISSSAGLAVQGAKYDYLVFTQKGQAANQLSNEVAMAKVLLRALG
jgi:hypothetical protein